MVKKGIHHISVFTSDAKQSYDFYHRTLGMRLTLKTVNQENNDMYHLFFGDQTGRGGTEFTVFPMLDSKPHQEGTNGIERVLFYVPSDEALNFWMKRFDRLGVNYEFTENYLGQKVIFFEDKDKMKLGLVAASEEVAKIAQPFAYEGIPQESAIFGMGQVHLRVKDPSSTEKLLTDKLGFQVLSKEEYKGFPVTKLSISNQWQHQVHLIEDKDSPRERLGVGGMHHVAFGVESTKEMENVLNYLDTLSIGHTNIKNREFFHSAYFREPNKTVVELATPIKNIEKHYQGIEADADFESIPLTLPSFLEGKRESIEKSLPY